MLATLGGTLALVLGLALLLLPLLAAELSRPRDSVWGAVVLLLGLVLVTSADRLTGAPMLAVLCGGLLIGRLGSEVAAGRWRQLSPEERQGLGTAERWRNRFAQSGAALARLASLLGAGAAGVGASLGSLRGRKSIGKRWVRREGEAPGPAGGSADGATGASAPERPEEASLATGEEAAPEAGPETGPGVAGEVSAPPAQGAGEAVATADPDDHRLVSGFGELDALLEGALGQEEVPEGGPGGAAEAGAEAGGEPGGVSEAG